LLGKNNLDSNFHKIAQWWGRSILRTTGVKLEIHGKEKFDPNVNYVFTSNHASLFDIPILMSAMIIH